MSDEVDLPGDLTNNAENFEESQAEHVGVGDEQITISNITGVSSVDGKITITTPGSDLPSDQFFVATSQGLFPAEQLSDGTHALKNCIIIQDQQSLDGLGLASNIRTIGVGANPLINAANVDDRSRTITKYQWEESVYDSVLPVRCKHKNGELHKSKFGSGKLAYCSIFICTMFLE